MSGRILIVYIAHLFLIVPIQGQIGTFVLPDPGIEVANLNPAKVTYGNKKWSVQLFSARMNGQTNHAFLHNESFLNLGREIFKKGDLIPRFQANVIPKIDYYDRSKSTFVKGHFRMSGPSFTVKVGNWHLGMLTGLNFSASASAIPSPLGYYNNYAIPIGTAYELNGGQGAGLLWTDIGIHFSRTWQIHRFKSLSWGMNVKYLNSYYGFGVKNYGSSIARKLGGGRVSAVSGSGEVLLSDAWRYETPFGIENTGSGLGVDVGIIMSTKSSAYAMSIEWGVSISNLGMIQLSKETSRTAAIKVQNEVELSADNFEESGFHPQASFSTFNELIRSKGNEVVERPGSVFYTPARIHAYISTPINKGLHGQLSWQQSLLWDYRSAVAMNYVAVSATYQLDQFAVSLPLTFMNYEQVWTGLTVRMGPLTIGSDRLFGTFLPHQRLDGASFFIGLKLDNLSFPFKTGWWPKRGVRCPKY